MATRLCAHLRVFFAALGGVLGCIACASDDDPVTNQNERTNAATPTPPEPAPDLTEAFFAAEHVVEVAVDIAPEDWVALSQEGRSLIDSFALGTAPYEYTYFNANVTVDGIRHENVAVRKKGFLGSLSILRPSLKINFDRNVPGQSHAGLLGLTLNNDKQDPSHTHQCMAYHLFTRAGLAASRCNLAHVVVNGDDLGTYANVESINEQLLARHFADARGNLYEGAPADFVTPGVDQLELKTNKQKNDRGDLAAMVTALNASDGELVEALSAVINLESFRTFWAMEVLVGNWDSYSGDANNYYAYHEPTTNRFFFLPWGPDAAFTRTNPFSPQNTSMTVYANGRIANRLYAIPEQRELYRQRLGELNDTLWDETTLLAEVDQIAQLAADAEPTALETQRSLIRSQKEQMRAALAEPAPDWIGATAADPSAASPPCYGTIAAVQGAFRTTWGDIMTATPGVGEFSLGLSLDGNPINGNWFGKAGLDTTGANAAVSFIDVLPDGRPLIVQLQLPPKVFKPGVVTFQSMETVGMVISFQGQTVQFIGYISDGAITFEQADTQLDSPVIGSFQGRLLQFGCLN